MAGYLWAAFAFGSVIGAMTLVRLHTRSGAPERVVLVAIFGVGTLMLLVAAGVTRCRSRWR